MCGGHSQNSSYGVTSTSTSTPLPEATPYANTPHRPSQVGKSKSGSEDIIPPYFSKETIVDGRKDGYWIETFKLEPTDKVDSLIA